nr:zinc finger, CCHC-type [Tanacetum cinerariifolium]
MLPTIIAQVGNHTSNIEGDVRNVNVNNSRGGCSYTEFLECNPMDYDGKREESKALMREDLCPNNEMHKLETEFWCYAMVEAGHEWSLKKNTKKIGNSEELSRDGNVRDDNKRSRTGRVFATITNRVRKEHTGSAPKCTNCNFYHHPEMPCRTAGPRMVNPLNAKNLTSACGACYECGGTDHYKAACPRLNRAPGQRGNHPNQAKAIEGGQGSWKQ